MGTPFIGELRIYSFNFPPKGWAFCNGQLLAINQNQALFSILGTTYGGNGQTNFALPDLRGRIPLHWGDGVSLGERAGQESHTLTIQEMPQHNHGVRAWGNTAQVPSPAGNTWGGADANPYATASNSILAPGSIGNAGGSQPHPNMSPYLVLNICIALVGVFPSRN